MCNVGCDGRCNGGCNGGCNGKCVTIKLGLSSPHLQVHCGVLFFEPNGFHPSGEGFTLTPSLIRPQSVGQIRLRSADPTERPIIEPRYLSDSGGQDMAMLVAGVKHVREIGREMLQAMGGRGAELHPGGEIQSDAQIEEYVRSYVGTMYHPACTCRVGRADDGGAVLDEQMRVRGASRLRVADASAMPEIVGANTNATCIALGEKVADLVARAA